MSVPITGTITTYAGGTYATIDPLSGIDGWRCVADHPTRNLITTQRRRLGMAVYCQSDPIGDLWILNTNTNTGTDADWTLFPGGGCGGGGSVTVVSVVSANGITGTVANSTSTPAITLTLGSITPSSIASSGTITGSNLSGTNTGDQTVFNASGAGHSAGIVPDPGGISGVTHFLREDATWAVPPGGGGSGTVTQINTASGITGGPITTSGTIGLATVPTLNILANTTGGTAAPSGVTLSAMMDAAFGSTLGDTLIRGSSVWQISAPVTLSAALDATFGTKIG